jgi:hypothetical protein
MMVTFDELTIYCGFVIQRFLAAMILLSIS